MNVVDGGKIVGGLVSGQLDLSTMSGFGQTFPAMAKGAKLKIVAGAALLPSLALFTTKPDIRTLKDLEGRVVGTGAIGSLLHQLVVALLLKYQVDVSKVRFFDIGGSGDVFRGVVMGTVDAGTGEVSVLEDPDAYKVRLVEHGNMSIELADYTYQGAWTSESAIAGRRDILVRALAAYAKMYRFVQTSASHDAFMKSYKIGLPSSSASDAEAAWKYIQTYKPFAERLVLDQKRLDYMQDLNIYMKIQTARLPFGQIADMSLAQEAIKLLG